MSYPSWHAVEEIDKAVDDVKDFLLPFEKGKWLRLALIVILTGGIFSGVPTPGPSEFGETDFENSTWEEDFNSIDNGNSNMDISDGLALALFGFVGGLALIFSYLSSVFQFIYFKSVKDKSPRIRKGFAQHWLNGIKYLVFKGVMFAAWIASFLIPLAALATESLAALLVSLVFMLPIWIVLFLITFSVNNYAVPKVSTSETGFIASILDGIQAFRNEWKQAAIFLLVKIALGIAVGVILALANLTIFLIVGIPVLIVSFLVYNINALLAVVPALIGVLILLTASVAIAIPVRTYMIQWVLNTYVKFNK